jgi:hypothetical protein
MAKLLHLSRPNRRVSNVIRTWLALRLQWRRRKRAAGGTAGVPAAPSNLQGWDTAGAVLLTWDMTAVEGELGVEIEGRQEAPEHEFEVLGVGGPNVSNFDYEIGTGGFWEFRVRAFNAAGYSGYSNVVRVEFL